MTEPLAYRNGQWIAAAELAVPVTDAGFMLGATVAEQLRTFGGRLFRLTEHLDRLMGSLAIVGVDPRLEPVDLASIAQRLADHNHQLLQPGDDLGLCIFVTPGPYPAFASQGDAQPLVCMHTYPLPFHLWAGLYERGQPLRITDVQQVPASCWPVELKCRSRMHYYLADRQARLAEPGARALLLDGEGKVREASTASVVIYRDGEGFIAPPPNKTLPGISIAVLQQLAGQLNIPFRHQDLFPEDVAGADEVLLCSTSPCLLPVTRLDGKPIGSGRPGPVFRQALDRWSRMVGLDIQAQARQFATRCPAE